MLPMPRFRPHRAQEAEAGRVRLEPEISAIATAATNVQIEGDAVLMIGTARLGREIETG